MLWHRQVRRKGEVARSSWPSNRPILDPTSVRASGTDSQEPGGRTAQALLGVLVLLAHGRALALEPAPASEGGGGSDTAQARGRLQLRTALALRNDTVIGPDRRIRARGQAPSQLALDGVWFPDSIPIGMGAHLEGQRFALRGEDPVAGPFDSVATSLEGNAGFWARHLALQGRLSLEGQLGYALSRTPVAQVVAAAAAGAMPVTATAFSAHGPSAGARVALAVGDSLMLETSARVRPVAFGARLADRALAMRAANAGASLLVGAFAGGGVRLSGLVGYELAWLSASGGGLQVRQLQHGIGIGLLGAFLLPSPPPPPPPPPPPAPAQPVVVVPLKPAPPERGVVRGVVRAAHASAVGPAGTPLPGVTVAVTGGPSTTTDTNGMFRLSGIPPGIATVRLSGKALIVQDEVLVIPPEGEVSVEVLLRPEESARLAAITGLVRSEDGQPVPARVSVVELGLVSEADAGGRFRLEVPAGRYTVVIEAPGLVTQRKALTVAAGEHSIYNLDLQRER
jgi:hypothetical protein